MALQQYKVGEEREKGGGDGDVLVALLPWQQSHVDPSLPPGIYFAMTTWNGYQVVMTVCLLPACISQSPQCCPLAGRGRRGNRERPTAAYRLLRGAISR